MKALTILFSLVISLNSCAEGGKTKLIQTESDQTQTEDIPATNMAIIKYVTANKGKKILRGECWDLVKAALNDVNANWTPATDFGKPVALKDIMPGDIISFKNVTFKGEGYSQSFGQHYAIVYKVKDGVITLAHQNYNNDRNVRFDPITPADKTKGELKFFRPQPGK